MIEKYSRSQYRNGHRFGFGTLTEIQNRKAESTEEEKRANALLAGWSHGCPIAEDLTGPNSPYSVESMLERYLEVNYWFNLIRLESQMVSRQLFRQLSQPKARLIDEPVGKHNSSCVPFNHLLYISPMSTPTGYASPRVLVEILKLNPNSNEKRMQAYGLVEKIIPKTKQPLGLLSAFGENAVLLGVEPVNVLSHTLSSGVLEEENCRSEYILIASELERQAPNLWRAYLGLNTEEKKKLEIAEIPTL